MQLVQYQGHSVTPTNETRYMLTVAGPGSHLYQTRDTFGNICLELESMGLNIEEPKHQQSTYTSEEVAVSLFAL